MLDKILAFIASKIAAMQNNTKDLVIANLVWKSGISVGANTTWTNTALDISAAIPSGYKLLEAYCGATGANSITCYQCRKSGAKTVAVQFRNWANANQTISPAIIAICIRDL